MFVWISNANALMTDVEKFYAIKSIEFLDSQSNSMINNVVIDQYVNLENIIKLKNPWLNNLNQ